jgi:hypothetical protein
LSRFDVTLSSTVELFTVQDEQKVRTLAEWLRGLQGLYNTVKVRQIGVKEDSTREEWVRVTYMISPALIVCLSDLLSNSLF